MIEAVTASMRAEAQMSSRFSKTGAKSSVSGAAGSQFYIGVFDFDKVFHNKCADVGQAEQIPYIVTNQNVADEVRSMPD